MMALVSNATFCRNSVSTLHRSNSTVFASIALIWLSSPVYPVGLLAQSTAV
jgi:hypothetical protein